MSFGKFTTLLVHFVQDSFYAAINIAIKGSVRLTSVKSIKRSLSLIMSLIYKRWLPLNGPASSTVSGENRLLLSCLFSVFSSSSHCLVVNQLFFSLSVCLCSPLTLISLKDINIQYTKTLHKLDANILSLMFC